MGYGNRFLNGCVNGTLYRYGYRYSYSYSYFKRRIFFQFAESSFCILSYYMRIRCRNRTFDIYDKAAAESKGIETVPNWRQAAKDDWILTADLKVLQVLGRTKLNAKTKKPIFAIRTGFGKTPTYKHNIYAAKCPDYQWDVFLKGKLTRAVKTTVLQQAFLEYLVENCQPDMKGMWIASDLIQAYMAVYQDNNPTNSLRRALWILKKDSAKEFMSMKMKDKLIEKGLDDDYVADRLKGFIEDKNAPHSVRLQALNKASDLLGHNIKVKKEQVQETVMILSDEDKKKLREEPNSFTNQLKN